MPRGYESIIANNEPSQGPLDSLFSAAAFCGLRLSSGPICLKNYDPKPCVVQWPPPPSGLTLLVLGYGLWFLLVPVLWSFLLMLRANRGPDFRSSISTAELGAGIVITLTLAFIFAHATFIALRLAWGGFVAL